MIVQPARASRSWLTHVEAACLDLACVIMCAIAFSQGVQATADLDWPVGDEDLYRDIAQAQAILQGRFWADPFYLGETTWYNPLTPAIAATVARFTDGPMPLVYTRLGAFLNLLAPISFYILAARLFGRWTAMASTLGFLFVSGNFTPSWTAATYSPWLFSASFVQAAFYISLTVYHRALQTQKRAWYLATGILLGITFLGHTAPALILGGIVGVTTIHMAARTRKMDPTSPIGRQAIDCFGTVVLSALLVSAPFLISILGHYRLSILNPNPASWVYDDLRLSNFWSFLGANLSQVLLVVVVGAGLIDQLFARSKRVERQLLMLWLLISLGFIAYSYLWQILEQNAVSLFSIVPGFHFLFYLRAAGAILFGCGLVAVSRVAAGWIRRPASLACHDPPAGSRWRERGLLSAALVLTFVSVYPAYLARDDFVKYPEMARQRANETDKTKTFFWISEHTQSDDVFLATDHWGTFVVAAAGRKVVAVNSFFSNPYVDWQPRATARQAMFDQIAAGDSEGFSRLAAQYRVTYVVVANERARSIEQAAPPFLQQVFASGLVRVYRVVSPK